MNGVLLAKSADSTRQGGVAAEELAPVARC